MKIAVAAASTKTYATHAKAVIAAMIATAPGHMPDHECTVVIAATTDGRFHPVFCLKGNTLGVRLRAGRSGFHGYRLVLSL